MKRDEVSRGWRKLHSEELHDLGKPERKRPLGRPRRRWVDYIILGLREIGRHGVDWMDMAQDRDQWRALVKTVLNLRVP
jgi:hypothetical protein